MHERIGHVRFPVAPQERRNPPTTGGLAAPDERVTEFMAFIEKVRAEAQIQALSRGVDPDGRATALGEYHAALKLRERFKTLFVTPYSVPPTVVDEAHKGEESDD
jgi:hypothetical protein